MNDIVWGKTLLEAIKADLTPYECLTTVSNGIIIMRHREYEKYPHFTYDVPLSEMMDINGFCDWIIHLLEKPWICRQHIDEICRIVRSAKHVK